jgi:hypothetical protein
MVNYLSNLQDVHCVVSLLDIIAKRSRGQNLGAGNVDPSLISLFFMIKNDPKGISKILEHK